MKRFYLRAFVVCLLITFACSESKASHAMGADLTYRCLGGNQYEFNLSFFRDCFGITPSSSFTMNISSVNCAITNSITLNALVGTGNEVSPLCPSQISNSTCNSGSLPGVQQWEYSAIFTLPSACTDWVFSIREGNRNAAITTISAPGSAWLYVEATLDNVNAPCNSSPSFTTLPVPYVCLNNSYVYNHGAIDVDGDSLVYSLIDALDNAGSPVTYNAGYSGINPLSSAPPVSINSANGNLNLNPTAIEIAVIAVLVEEYRNGILIGSAIRDIQVTVLNCTNNVPLISPITNLTGATQTAPYSMEVCPGTPISFDIPGLDADVGDSIFYSWNNGIPGGVFVSDSGNSPITSSFSWTPGAGDIGLNALTLSLIDNACPTYGSQVIAIDIVVLDGTFAGPDLNYCPAGGPVLIDAGGGSIFSWNTLSGDAGGLSCFNCEDPMASPSITSVYEIVSNLSATCKNRDTVIVNVVPDFMLTMSPDDTVCLGGATNLSAVPNPAGTYTYAWAPAFSLDDDTISTPSASPSSTTKYGVTVTSAMGCRMRDSVEITVTSDILMASPAANPTLVCNGSPVDLYANVGGGACDDYVVSSITYNPISGSGSVLALGDDQVSAALNIGFTFNYFCNDYTQLYVSSNGWLTFTSTTGSDLSEDLIPTIGGTDNLIAFAWDDLYPPGGGTIEYFTLGLAPNRIMVLNFSGVPHCCSAANPTIDLQVLLYESSNIIEIHNTSVNNDGGTMTQGIENIDGSIGFPSPGRNMTVWTATNDAVRFTQSQPIPYYVTWQAPLGNTVGSGDTLIVSPGANTTYFAVVRDSNNVCSTTESVLVETASADAGTAAPICAGDTVSLSGSYTGPAPSSNCTVYNVSSISHNLIAGTGAPISLGDDATTTALPIGFTFNFFCTDYTQFYVSSNGWLSFTAPLGSDLSEDVIPTAGGTDNLIAFAWDDLYPPGGGSFDYFTVGTTPNRVLVLNVNAIPHCCSGTNPTVDLQIQLYEGTNIIEIHNTNVNNDGGTMTQGIEDQTGAIGYPSPGRNMTIWSAVNDAVRFAPQVGSVTYTWNANPLLSNTSISNPDAENVPASTWFYLTVDNGSCLMTDSVFVDISCGPLPVDGLHLSGEQLGALTALTWTNLREENLHHYDVERSLNGLDNFEKIGKVMAVGDREYAFEDLFPSSGANFYRLSSVDENGAFGHSNVVEVFFSESRGLTISPNPSSGLFHFQLEADQGETVKIRVYDQAGKMIRKTHLELSGGATFEKDIDLSGMADGMYFYRIQMGAQNWAGKIVLSR